VAGQDVDAIAMGQTESFVMNVADVLVLNSNYDLSGTTIESDQPIGVFGGSPCANVPIEVTFCDHLEHQLFPLSAWGVVFVAARSPVRSSAPPYEKDYWRIVAAEDDTYIETDPPIPGLDGVMLASGETVEAGTDLSFVISASAPIMVGQFLTGQAGTDVPFEENGGDPAFALVTPVEQHREVHTVFVPPDYGENYAVITHPLGSDPSLDGELVSSLSECEAGESNEDFSVTRCSVSFGGYVISAEEPIAVVVWGYGSRVSYGYTAGFGVAAINEGG
jgi:hypothetical protein